MANFADLPIETRVRVNEAIINSFKTQEGLDEFRKAMKADPNPDKEEAFQTKLDAKRIELVENLDSLPPTSILNNGIQEIYDAGALKTALMEEKKLIATEVKNEAYYSPKHHENVIDSSIKGYFNVNGVTPTPEHESHIQPPQAKPRGANQLGG